LEAAAAALPAPARAVPVHRDFYYSQLLFHGPETILIDFDLIARGDPAIDVANFLAHLVFLGLDRLGDRRALAAEGPRFRQAYAARRPVEEGFWRRVSFYEAATYFRLMNVVSARPGLAALYEPMQAITAESLEAL
jgi:aminoglycoside phosphotransferase (APT) family kinase protein